MNIYHSKIFCFLCILGVTSVSYAFFGAIVQKLNPFNALLRDEGNTWRTDSIENRVEEICASIEKKDYTAVGHIFNNSRHKERVAILEYDNQRVMRCAQALQNEFSDDMQLFYQEQVVNKSRSCQWVLRDADGTYRGINISFLG